MFSQVTRNIQINVYIKKNNQEGKTEKSILVLISLLRATSFC